MSTDSNPPVLEQPADAPPAQPTVHQLTVAPEYALGLPDFAAPALSQLHHVLSVESYITGTLAWGAAAIDKLGYYRIQVIWKPVGRPPAIADDLVARWIPLVEQFVIEKQLTASVKLMGTSPQVVNFVQDLAGAAGIAVDNEDIIRLVTRPAVRNLRHRNAEPQS
jgi:hypothetical protein